MKKKIIFFLTGIIMCFLFVTYLYVRIMRPHQGVEGRNPAGVYTAYGLYRLYLHNEPAADSLCLGRVLEISGRICSWNPDEGACQLSTGCSGHISCQMFPTRSSSSVVLGIGDSITVRGRCTGFLLDVNMVDCIMQQKF